MRRVGILGGTFNPIHLGHLVMAEVARDQLKLDRVIFIPSYLPPHKSVKDVIDAHDRYHMVRLAIENCSSFEVSDIEILRQGKSYSIDTVRAFKERLPRGTQVYFIIGEDSLTTLKTWKEIEKLLKLVKFVVVNRPGSVSKSKIKTLSVEMPGLDISSSEIRKRIHQGKTVKFLVSKRIEDYIKTHQLYQ